MHGVEIRDAKATGALSFDLVDILDAIGPETSSARWCCENVDAFGPASRALHVLSDDGRVVSGAELRRIANGVHQVVDGDFTGRRDGDESCFLVVRAIDSTLWEVFGNEEILGRVRERFADVRRAGYEYDAG